MFVERNTHRMRDEIGLADDGKPSVQGVCMHDMYNVSGQQS